HIALTDLILIEKAKTFAKMLNVHCHFPLGGFKALRICMFLYYIELRLVTLSITNYHTCRNNLKRYQLHGESDSADINAIENAPS
ncbi:13416_t:CDS:1, partial [Entrophospora sp. SA101]